MITFLSGMAVGLIFGGAAGFFVCALLNTSADIEEKPWRQ